jgi:hypothetical protein
LFVVVKIKNLKSAPPLLHSTISCLVILADNCAVRIFFKIRTDTYELIRTTKPILTLGLRLDC